MTIVPKDPRRNFLRALLITFGIAGIVAIGILLSRRAALASPSQPLPMSHRRHAEAEVQCLFCHPSATRSEVAGIPSVAKCMGCHRTIATEQPAIETLAGYWKRREPIPWQRVSPSADFVYFNHQPHLAAGVSCETCHGEVGSMDLTRPAVVMDMGWCLGCHLQQPTEKIARLADCMACHK